ncbi:hypothetical protein CSC12_4365 [Klebsiella michiganensis]|nr:hypothetical protein CSC12_4365 [Klebsiella michiganensis]
MNPEMMSNEVTRLSGPLFSAGLNVREYARRRVKRCGIHVVV